MSLPAPPPPPPPPPPATPPPASGLKSKVLLGVVAALALLVPAGIGIGVGATILGSAPAVGAQPSAPAASSPTAEPSASTPPVQPIDFASVSGNIRCHIDADAAYCHQGAIRYAAPPSNCSAEGVAVGVTSDGAYWPCLGARPALPASVPYDQPVVNGEFTCVINFTTGVRCTNAAGAGFTMEVSAGVTTF